MEKKRVLSLLLAAALLAGLALPAAAAGRTARRYAAGTVVYYNSYADLRDAHPDVYDWNSGCFTCAIAMILTTMGRPNATPYDIWRANGNQTYIASWDHLASLYGVATQRIDLSGTAAVKEQHIRNICRQNPQGVFLWGNSAYNGSSHAVVAYLDAAGTLRVHNPGYYGWDAHIVGVDDRDFTSYDQFAYYRTFTDPGGTPLPEPDYGPDAPVISSVSNVASGIRLEWNAVAGADKYWILCKEGAGWKKLADTRSTRYTWTGAEQGKDYTFAVRTLSGEAYSDYSASVRLTRLVQPTVSVVNVSSGGREGVRIVVTNKDQYSHLGVKYRFYGKREGESRWTRLADLPASDTQYSYIWQGAVNGEAYRFTVRAVAGSSQSSYQSTGKLIRYFAAPRLGPAVNTSLGIRLAWQKVPRVARYEVMYRFGQDSAHLSAWAPLVRPASSAGSYLYAQAQPGMMYRFSVRCLNSVGAVLSGYDTAGVTVLAR